MDEEYNHKKFVNEQLEHVELQLRDISLLYIEEGEVKQAVRDAIDKLMYAQHINRM